MRKVRPQELLDEFMGREGKAEIAKPKERIQRSR